MAVDLASVPEGTSATSVEVDDSVPLAVETRALRKVYGQAVAVADLSISVCQGEIFGFLGPNGAGKTTSVKMLMGLIRPTSGNARLLGRPLGDREAKRKIGFLPELFRFHDWLTGEELLDFHGKLYGMRPAERRQRIPELLDRVGLADRRRDPIRAYSKGMQQRIGLAQALLNDPEVVFLDEPTSALDPVGRMEVREIIRSLRAEGKTVFLNSHLLSEVEMVCDRVAIVNHGQVAAIGRVADLLKRNLDVTLTLGAWDERVERLLASSGNVLGVECDVSGKAVLRYEVADDEQIAATVERLVQAGVPVYGVAPRGLTLEELFFEVVKANGQRAER